MVVVDLHDEVDSAVVVGPAGEIDLERGVAALVGGDAFAAGPDRGRAVDCAEAHDGAGVGGG